MKLTGAEIFLESLKREGVNTLFALPGGVVLKIFDVLHQQKDIQVILTRHEQGAGHMAEGYAKATGKADADGKWLVKLATPAAGCPHELKVKGKNEVTFKDVLVGEVWICSGQSNMEWTVKASDSPDEEAKAARSVNNRTASYSGNFLISSSPSGMDRVGV